MDWELPFYGLGNIFLNLISRSSSCLEVPNRDILTFSPAEMFSGTSNITVEVIGVPANLHVHTLTPSFNIY